MSARPHRRGRQHPHDRARELFGPLDGARIRGGCEWCDAYQRVRPITAGVWNITVFHDDWCPFWRRIRREAS
jgi:hypothetical protein